MKKLIGYYVDIMFFSNNDRSLHLTLKKKTLKIK